MQIKSALTTLAMGVASVATLLCLGGNAEAACITGGALDNIDDCLTAAGKGGKECLLVWGVPRNSAGDPSLDKKGNVTKSKIECVDGDACDMDGTANGVCTFHWGACVNAPGTPTGGNACVSGTLDTLELKKPNDKDVNKKAFKLPQAVYVARALNAELGTGGLLPSPSTETCTAEDLELKVPLKTKKGFCFSLSSGTLTTDKCEGDAECADGYCVLTTKKNKQVVKAIVSDGLSTKDADALKFFCLPSAAGTQSAEALDLDTGSGATAADLIGGPLAQGRLDVGDHLLRNGHIRLIVRGPGRERMNFYQQGGHVLDADLVRDDPADDRDSWMGEQLMLNLSNTQATDTVTVLNDGTDGNAAIVRTSGEDTLVDFLTPDVAIYTAGDTLSTPLTTDDVDLPVDLVTDYVLKGDANYVQVVTTVNNQSASELVLMMGGYLNPGGELEAFGPDMGFGEPQLRLGSSVPGFGRPMNHLSFQGIKGASGVTYGWVFDGHLTFGALGTSAFAQSGIFAWVDRVPLLGMLNSGQPGKAANIGAAALKVPGNDSNSFRRWFVVGETIDDVSRAREQIFASNLAIIQGTITRDGDPVEGARVAALRGIGASCIAGFSCASVQTATITDENGFYRIVVSEGTYRIAVRADGTPYDPHPVDGPNVPNEVSVTVKKKKTEVLDVDLPATGSLQVTIADHNSSPIAGKVSVVGIPESPEPFTGRSPGGFLDAFGRYFGTPIDEKDNDVFGLVDVRFTDPSGDTGTFSLEPGNYHVVVSHGPEYDVYDQAITITSGVTTVVNATVNQVVDTSGFVSIDTHVHSLQSPDSTVSAERRVTSMLAEGVDFYATTDHGYLDDHSPTVTALGAGSLIKTAIGEEVTTFSYGHFNVWPQVQDGSTITNGALDWGRMDGFPSTDLSYDLLPSEIFGSYNPATQVIQIDHFNSSTLGHFNNIGIDTESVPPESSMLVYRCSGTPIDAGSPRASMPCNPEVCIGGSNDGGDCSTNGDPDCPGGVCNPDALTLGRDCPGTSDCVAIAGTLASELRMDPAVTDLYSNDYTALEVWIEQSRSQTDLALHDNLGDWVGLINQGIFKTGIADSDTHSRVIVQAGGPRTYVASPTDAPGSIVPGDLAMRVNEGRAIGSGGLFMTVELIGDLGAIASHALGDPLTVAADPVALANSIDIHVESPPWAEFDTIDVYINSVPACVTGITFFGVADRECDVAPTTTLSFTPTATTGVSGFGQRLVHDVSIPLTVTQDTWVIVVARGTDGVSHPLFPVNPLDLQMSGNLSLAGLTDSGSSPPWNLGQSGQLAMAFSNPLFFDAEPDGLCHGGSSCP